MHPNQDSVGNRLTNVKETASVTDILAGLLFATALSFTLLFIQDPLVHDSLHNFRHVGGVVCH